MTRSLAVVSFALLLASTDAHGRSRIERTAKGMSDQAAKLFKGGNYVGAAELFERAYALDASKPIRLRNAGRSYEEAKRTKRALHCFTRYVTLTTNPKLIEDAKRRIKRLEAVLKAQRAANAPPPVKAKPAAPKIIIQRVEAPTRGTHIGVKVGTALLGAVATVGGIYWWGLSATAQQTVDQGLADGSYEYDGGAAKLADDQDTLRLNKAFALTMGTLGVAAVGTSLWLFLRNEEPDKRAMWAPIGPNGTAGMSAALRF